MRRNEESRGTRIGVGYVSVMLIFAVICLTIFAVLSFTAAVSTDSFNDRSGEFMRQYYAADTSAKETLSDLNDCALEAVDSGFFEDVFQEAAGSMEGVTVRRVQGGFSVSYAVTINERQELAVDIVFDSSGKYKIELWQSREVAEEESGSHLGVWNGSF